MDYRIKELREYLFEVLQEISDDNVEQINANSLSNDINNYSLDKIPTKSEIEHWIVGITIRKDVYAFRSRKAYSKDAFNNLNNIGFFEKFEKKIKSNNEKGKLPNIENIEAIECLNCGTMIQDDTNTAMFDIQIQITYRDDNYE